jgi:hypothetical protein
MVQPARQQDLLDQLVQLDEIARDLLLALLGRLAPEKIDRHPEPSEWRTQLVARIGEQGRDAR